GDAVKFVDERASSLPDCRPLLTSRLGSDSPASWNGSGGSVNVLVQLAVSMRAHGRGGLLLVVPGGSDAWRESIVQPILYTLRPPFAELADLMRQTEQDMREQRRWQDACGRVVDAVAGVTAVDGATVWTEPFELRPL